MKTVITGSIAFDYLMSFPGKFSDHLLADQLDKVSVSFLVDSMRLERGGIAPNIAYTNALLGGRPTVMATAGKDFHEYRDWLEDHGVDTSGVVIYEDDFCASFFVNTDEMQNQIATFYTGAMSHAGELSFAKQAADAELAIISPNDPQAMCAYVTECKELGISYIYDPSQQIVRLEPSSLVKGIEGSALLAGNEYELAMIEEKTGLTRDGLLAKAGGLLITLGKQGSQILVDGRTYEIPAVRPRTIAEPTGAGDAFRGGLLRGMQLGLSWETSGRMGALAAAYVLESFGTQGHYFTPADFVARYRTVFDDEGTLDVLLT